MVSKKKIAAISLAAILVVAVVVGVTVGVIQMNKKNGDKQKETKDINSSMKAVDAVCKPTDHKEICVKTLKAANGNETDPKQLIMMAFNIAIKQMEKSDVSSSKLFKDLKNNPRTKKALDVCHEVAELAINDLKRTLEQINNFDLSRISEMLENAKIWLSAARTYEETCLDGFENIKGNAGQKMKAHMKDAMQLTDNTLAMVEEIAKAFSLRGFNRRLLSTGGMPTWTSKSGKKLLAGDPKDIKASIVVAKDGSGDFKTIMEAIDSIPKERMNKTIVVHVKEGVYVEKVIIAKHLTNLVLMGDGPTKTKITGNLNYADGTQTFHTATVVVMGDNFVARDISFENSAGHEKHQAVAVRVSADFAAFHNCRFDGYQDTLYSHSYRQFYSNCTISGTIDFIFGDSAAVFQSCNLLVRKCGPNQFNAVTAQGRKNPRMPTGIVLQNCTIMADPENPPEEGTKSYLGRPWKEFSRTIIMESDIGSVIDPQGYTPWMGTFALDTLFYAEYNNRGASMDKSKRIKWKTIHEIKKEVAEMFTPKKFLSGDSWIPVAGVPYKAGFFLRTPADAKGALGLKQAGEWGIGLQKDRYVEKKQNNTSTKHA